MSDRKGLVASLIFSLCSIRAEVRGPLIPVWAGFGGVSQGIFYTSGADLTHLFIRVFVLNGRHKIGAFL
jgi:hypothetical protein